MSLKISSTLIIVLLSIAIIRPSDGAEDLQEHYLIPHNKVREEAGLPPLTWSKELEDYAYSTAVKHKVGCELEHSGGGYPENIAGGTGDIMTGTDATNMWVSEKQFYDPVTQTCAEGQICGHYQNIIASETMQMGCVKINCDVNDGLIFQCDYSR